MSKEWFKKLSKLEGAVIDDYDPYSNVIRSPSPSFNFIFGRTHGLPLGHSMVLYGTPKSGKSLICNAIIAQMHKDDPESVAVRFNTEFRESQMTPKDMKAWGIDRNRFMGIETNSPAGIFDQIEEKIPAMIQEGVPIKLIIIDSVSSIRGRRDMNAKTIETMQRGDRALTLQEGLARILEVQKRNKIALIFCSQARVEQDETEQMRGNKIRMSAGFSLQHYCEYFVYVERDRTSKTGKTDLLNKEFVNESLGDIDGTLEKTGHKIWVCMENSTVSPHPRAGEFTIEYSKGIVSQHEEIFLLGVNRGIITKPNQLSYIFKDKKWAGKPDILEAIKNEKELYDAILKEIKLLDLE